MTHESVGVASAASVAAGEGEALVLAGGRVLLDGHGGEPSDVDLLIQNGRIAAVGKRSDFGESAGRKAQYIDAAGLVILPGLIDAHTHSQSWIAPSFKTQAGPSSSSGASCAAWLAMGPEQIEAAAQLTALDALRHGVTTVVDHASVRSDHLEPLVAGYRSVGIRAVLALDVCDPRHTNPTVGATVPAAVAGAGSSGFGDDHPSHPATVDEIAQLASELDAHPLLSAALATSTLETWNKSDMQAIAEQCAGSGLWVYSHLPNNGGTSAYDALQWLEELSLSGTRISLFCGPDAKPDSVERLLVSGANLAYCPWLLAPKAPVQSRVLTSVASKGKVALATGGPEYSPNGSLTELARGLALCREPSTGEESRELQHAIWDMLTSDPQDITKPDHGGVRQGAAADLLLVHPPSGGWRNQHDPVEETLLRGLGRSLETVIVGGMVVMDRGQILTKSETEIWAKGQYLKEKHSKSLSGQM